MFGWYKEARGPEALTNLELDAWARLRGIRPTCMELDLMRSLDCARWKVRRELSNE